MPQTPEQKQWLVQHLPHRLRATLAGTPLLVQLLEKHGRPDESASIAAHCDGNAAWEGRLSAARWLIDFVGIKWDDKKKGPGRPAQFPHDWRIDKMGAALFPLDDTERAKKLADVWLGCTKATSHPTTNSDHPPVDEEELNTAVAIVIDYIERTIYAPAGLTVATETLTLHPLDPRRPSASS